MAVSPKTAHQEKDLNDLKPRVEQFNEDGFLQLQQFFTPDEAAQMEADLDRYIAEVVATMDSSDVMYEEQSDARSLKQIAFMERHDAAFRKLRSHPRITVLARALLDDDVVPQYVQAFIKPPRQGTATPPHQDGFYFCLTPNEALTFWIPVGDIDSENGALCYRRGSHRQGVIDHGGSGVLGFSQGLAMDKSDLGEEVVCAVEKGDCLVHHSLTVHSAMANPSSRVRRALGLVFYAARARKDEEAQQRYQASLRRQRKALGVA